MRLTDDDILSICEAEISAASGWADGELAKERADALDYYLGEPYGDEQPERSKVVTREVFDVVEGIMPSVMRILGDAENLIEFAPVGPEDEAQAKQESETVSYVFWKENRGWWNLYQFCKDALLSKNGILKIWWDDYPEEEREEYTNLNDAELALLLNEEGVEREVDEYEANPDGTHHVVFLTSRTAGKACVEVVPPEEFGISRDARSPYVEDAGFCYHRARKTVGELVEMGYDREQCEGLGGDDDVDTSEELARRHLDDERSRVGSAMHKSMRAVWVAECYMLVDRDDDGIPELLKVTLADGSESGSGYVLLKWNKANGGKSAIEEVDCFPFFSASPIPLTHKFHGLSVADATMTLQRIKSTLLRQVLDATYHATNPRLAVNERVNLDDLMTNRPGGFVQVDGEDNPLASIAPIPNQPVPQQNFELLEYLDREAKRRTGYGDDVAALDSKSLASVSSTVMALAVDAARAKIEMYVRVLAEVALRPAFHRIHELLSKHNAKAMTVRLRNAWVQVNPGDWRTRHNSTVMVGLGLAGRERRLLGFEAMWEKMVQARQLGIPVALDAQVYNLLSDFADAHGLTAARYWQDPALLPPPQPQPDPNMMALQLQARLGEQQIQTERAKVQADLQKAAISARLEAAKLEHMRDEAELKAQAQQLKTEIAALKQARDQDTKVAKLDVETALRQREQDLKAAQLKLDQAQQAADRKVELYQSILAAGTTLTVEQMRQMAGQYTGELQPGETPEAKAQREAEAAEAAEQSAMAMAEMQARVVEMTEQMAAMSAQRNQPLAVERDASGRAVSVGGRPIRRNAAGLIEAIG